ncbi:TolB family protein [Paenibacillus alkalitolerans]|uniref:TolB family protein n=1 Tax=Paenibacillus alkalitolerans TaxID=2799335 RepID=UPI0018F6DED0|nr:hypothetical protein [Paenibacillus alkalitolerans]
MDERQVEEYLMRLKNKIKINEQLKQNLRTAILGWKRRRMIRRRAFISAVAAVALLFAFTFQLPGEVEKVEAASLKIQNQVSFVDIGSGNPLGVSEYNGSVYIPAAGKGVFVYDPQGFRRITDQEASEVDVDPAGSRLLLSNEGTIGVYDLQNKTYTELLRGDGKTEFYEQPSWKDEHTILYVKKVTQPQTSQVIYEMDIDGGKPAEIGEGTHPSYSESERAVVFQRDDQVVKIESASGNVTVIDEGRFPSVSRDGDYVAYVKSKDNADQVWIADVSGRTKRAVTQNVPELYSYYNPVWGSGSESLYVLKKDHREGSQTRIMRIDFSEKTLEAIETVKAFNQAVIRRDDDFARSLLRNDPDFLTVTNPRQVSYSILGSGQEGEREYVDVEEHWSYTANPSYSIQRVRYFLSESPNGYLIDEMKKTGWLAVSEAPDGSIQVQEEGQGGGKQTLFTIEDIPKELLPKGEYRFSSLAFIESRNTLIFTVQALQDPNFGQKSSVMIVSYDTGTKTFQPLEHITSVNGMENVGVANMIVSSTGDYAALDLFSDDDKTFASHLLVLDLKNKERVWIEEQMSSETGEVSTHSYYWDEGNLHFTLTSGGETMYYKWDAINKKMDRP